MRRARAAIGIAAASLALLGPASTPTEARRPAAPAVSPAEEAQLREVARRGELLYAYDQAAWHGTDDMVAKLPDYGSRVGGWIVDGPAEAPELVFFDEEGARAVYVARFRDGKLVSSRIVGAGENELSPSRRQLIAAREAALAALIESRLPRCSEAAMNSVVLPPASPGAPTLVYLMTAQRVMEALPFGGHYLVPVDAAGRAGAIRRFANSCVEMNLADAPGGARPAALAITHLLDPIPTEIHVFSSLAARLPVAVGTRDRRTWWVEGTRISLVDKRRR